MTIAVEPKSRADREKMSLALSRIAAEDPSLFFSYDTESGEALLKGMGELHLDNVIGHLKSEFKVEVHVGAPQVAYRETITKIGEIDYTHKMQTGGSGQYARVLIRFEPGEPGSGYRVVKDIVGGAIPKEFIPGVEKGLETQKDTGVIAGFPCIDFKATLFDGAYHEVDSSVRAFEIAAGAAFREGIPKCKPVLLEPIMKVDVMTPEDHMGDVMASLIEKRGYVTNMEARGNTRLITATVPLANMFGYANVLRSMTQGLAEYSMEFDHYDQVPSPDDHPPKRPAVIMRG